MMKMLEPFLIFVLFFIFGFLTDYIDELYDLGLKPSLAYIFSFFIVGVLSLAVALERFPSEFFGILFGLALARKLDRLSFIAFAALSLILLLYLRVELVWEVFVAFSLVAFFDEQAYFVSMERPLLKLFSLAYALIYGNIKFLLAFFAFDLGYMLSTYMIKKKKWWSIKLRL